MSDYPYKISVVMAVYNTAEYLEEAIQSVIHQTIGFENVQMVLVDDGSTDGSEKICDQYGQAYPDQIQVIHQENKGRAAASNAGLPCAQGRYVNFLDSDDKLSENAFEVVYDFFVQHESQTDIVSIPMRYFGAKEGNHPLNYKYKEGTRVASLREETEVVQLHLGSAFVRHETAEKMEFDTTQVVGIDARACMKVLLDKMTVGLVAEATYYYRIRASENLSILQAGKFKPKRYGYHLERFSLYVLDLYRNAYGTIPDFVQYTVMYELQSRIRQKQIPEGVLNEEELARYKDNMCLVLKQIDDDIILAQRKLSFSQKIMAISLKYQKPVWLSYEENEAWICVGDKRVLPMSELATQINRLVCHGKKMYVSGYMNFVGLEKEEDVDICVRIREKLYSLKIVETKVSETWLGEFNTLRYFEGEIPISAAMVGEGMDVLFEVRTGQCVIARNRIRFGGELKKKRKRKKILIVDFRYFIRIDADGFMQICLRKRNLPGRLMARIKQKA